jgi:hypothetical protein
VAPAAKPRPKKAEPRKRAAAHRWKPLLEAGSRCAICGLEKRPERKPSARAGRVFALRYFKQGEDLGRAAPKCLTGAERQVGIFDPERFE